MPRLTHTHYVQNREALIKEWKEFSGDALALLPFEQQQQLNTYYRPTKQLDDALLLAHRKTISKVDPSLPQLAGKAFLRIRPYLHRPKPKIEDYIRGGPRRWSNKNRAVRVFSQMNPDLDPHEFARMLLRAASEQARKEREPRDSSKDDHEDFINS